MGVSIHIILMNGEYMQSSTEFLQKKIFFFAASLVKVIASPVTVKDFNAFVDISRCKNWAHKIFS